MAKGKKKPQAKPQAKPPKAISPLAPKSFAHLPPLAGVRLATGEAGIKYKDRTDVLLAILAPGTEVAGVFTRSKTASAPVEWCRTLLKRGQARALVVNSGNANAFTGQAGQAGVRAVAEAAAAVVGCKASEVFLASTGVIGEPLPSEKITKILSKVADDASASGWRAAAEAIMTTDTFPKLAT
ncbi:MAG TPA: bifunctional ornithine acetyltransferase/N-acetylglutamate synthase, partial [Rhizomicrobium sp.]